MTRGGWGGLGNPLLNPYTGPPWGLSPLSSPCGSMSEQGENLT